MIGAIHHLLNGDAALVNQFQNAKAFWDEFLIGKRESSIKQLAHDLALTQRSIEGIFHSRSLGKELMPYTCLGSLYDPQKGFGDNRRFAVKIARAFLESKCSIEVEAAVKDAIILYMLNYDDEELAGAVKMS